MYSYEEDTAIQAVRMPSTKEVDGSEVVGRQKHFYLKAEDKRVSGCLIHKILSTY
jgi:hypothetical protein